MFRVYDVKKVHTFCSHKWQGMEIDMDMVKNMSNEYAEAKKRAIKGSLSLSLSYSLSL